MAVTPSEIQKSMAAFLMAMKFRMFLAINSPLAPKQGFSRMYCLMSTVLMLAKDRLFQISPMQSMIKMGISS
jgi:hypothetical protein